MRTCMVISSNKAACRLLTEYFEGVDEISLMGIHATVSDATAALKEHFPDILITDIKILFELGELELQLPKALICLGNQSAILDYKIAESIFAFLHVPFSRERIQSLFRNVLEFIGKSDGKNIQERAFIFVKSDYKYYKVQLNDILFLSGMRDYTQIYLKSKNTPLTTLQNLKDFEKKLPIDRFIRVHRSFIISMAQIDSISRNEIGISTHSIPIGNSYRKELDLAIAKNS